ncbi:MAG: extracellular solute-binding protein, partial [Lachnospiraceae bacterium]|nr:extracellular solute-binding protein [Lachnospiraceae bacterium]
MIKMKKIMISICLVLSVILMSSCGDNTAVVEPEETDGGQEDVELTLWAFPVGNWGNPTAVSNILTSFHRAYPDIHISVEYLNYESGDAKVNQAVSDGAAPDLILEGPERLVTDWGAQGWMVDLSDLWESEKAGTIYDMAEEACRYEDGAYYEFPICTSAHCMAINYDMFREAGALKYIDEETRTWTTEGFIQAVQALTANGQKNAGIVYCKNQSGDQGTRALVNNLYGGAFTDDAHTAYTVDSEENRKALQLLYDLEGITFEPDYGSSEAINMFCQKETAMCFCWNESVEVQQTLKYSDLDFDVFPMAFPTDGGTPKLQGGI